MARWAADSLTLGDSGRPCWRGSRSRAVERRHWPTVWVPDGLIGRVVLRSCATSAC